MIMVQNESLKNILGQVLNHYRTGTSLKTSVGRQDHTVNALFFVNLSQKNLPKMQTVL